MFLFLYQHAVLRKNKNGGTRVSGVDGKSGPHISRVRELWMLVIRTDNNLMRMSDENGAPGVATADGNGTSLLSGADGNGGS